MSVARSAPTLTACRGVTVLHGRSAVQVAALRDIDFELAEGERVALFGPSGSGQTTLLHVIGGLIVPQRGEVTWRGGPLPSLQSSASRRGARIALVFQNANLLPTFTAFENVAFAVNAAGDSDSSAPDAEQLLGLVGLADKLDALPAELSGGEAQRVAIARALAQGPQLLLCDEPTGHLNSATAGRVLDGASGQFHLVPFHVAGVVQEFPAAPRDSFMVANLSYLRAADHAGGPNLVFARTSDPATTAVAIAATTSSSGVSVKSIAQQTRQTVSSITTIDLTGISRIEEAFVIALAGAAMALYVALVLSERRHEFATMAAVGESRRSISAFITSEVVLVLAIGLVLAAALGTSLSLMLVAMLQHVFDPPPDQLVLPWGFLAELAGAAVLVAVLAVAVSARRLRHLPLGSLLREQ